MKHERDTQVTDLTGRIRSLEQFSGSLVARPRSEGPGHDVAPVDDLPPSRVPRARRSRVFLRSGGGHGAFADLTLTTPLPRAAPD